MPRLPATSDDHVLLSDGNSTPPTREIIIMPLSPAHGRGLGEHDVDVVPLPDANTLETPDAGQQESPDGSFDTSIDGISTPQTLTHTTSSLDDSNDQKNGSGHCSPGGLGGGEANISGPTSTLNQLGPSNSLDGILTDHQVTREQSEPLNGKAIYDM